MCIPLSHCCFFVDLDVGAKIISIVNMVLSVVFAMIYGTAAMLPSYVAEARKVVYAIIATVAMLQLILGSLVIYGIFGRKPKLILPWILMCGVNCISLLVLSIIGTVLVVLQYTRDRETTNEVSTMSSIYFLYALILYYFASVVNSRREKMLNDDQSDAARGMTSIRRDYKYSKSKNIV